MSSPPSNNDPNSPTHHPVWDPFLRKWLFVENTTADRTTNDEVVFVGRRRPHASTIDTTDSYQLHIGGPPTVVSSSEVQVGRTEPFRPRFPPPPSSRRTTTKKAPPKPASASPPVPRKRLNSKFKRSTPTKSSPRLKAPPKPPPTASLPPESPIIDVLDLSQPSPVPVTSERTSIATTDGPISALVPRQAPTSPSASVARANINSTGRVSPYLHQHPLSLDILNNPPPPPRNTLQIKDKDNGLPSFSEIGPTFDDMSNAIEYLTSCNILIKPNKCPHCKKPLQHKDKNCTTSGFYQYRCRSKLCPAVQSGSAYSISILKHSILWNSHLPPTKFLHFCLMWLLNTDQKAIRTLCDMSRQTVSDWDMYLRDAISLEMCADQVQIGGPGVVVEIDESKFGKRKYHRGHRVDGCWVFGGIERLEPNSDNPYQEQHFGGTKCRAGKSFAVIVDKRDADTLLPIIKKFILPGSIIISDGWGAYNGIKDIPHMEYTHETVNHSQTFKDPDTGAHTNTVEGAWGRRYKSSIPSRSYNKENLQSYIFKQMWLAKHKGRLWDALMCNLASVRYQHQDQVPAWQTHSD